MARTEPQVNFRMPAELKACLEAAARENKRSITAELVVRLEMSFQEAAAKPGRSMVTPGIGLQDADAREANGRATPISTHRYEEALQRQREELQANVEQALRVAGEQVRDEIRLYLEQESKRMGASSAVRAPMT